MQTSLAKRKWPLHESMLEQLLKALEGGGQGAEADLEAEVSSSCAGATLAAASHTTADLPASSGHLTQAKLQASLQPPCSLPTADSSSSSACVTDKKGGKGRFRFRLASKTRVSKVSPLKKVRGVWRRTRWWNPHESCRERRLAVLLRSAVLLNSVEQR